MIRIPVKIPQGAGGEPSTHQLRHVPQGRFGALIDGMVFPIDAEGMVNLDGPHFYPRDCPPALELPEHFLRLAERSAKQSCRLEQATRGQLIVHLDGSASDLSRLLVNLEASRFSIDCAGAAYRPADNGQQFDWFIRLNDSNVDPWKIVSCVEGGAPTNPPTPLDLRALDLGARVARSEEALADAEAALSEQEVTYRQSLGAISVQAAMLRAAMEAQRERADAEVVARTRLAKEVERLASELSESRASADTSGKVRQLEEQLSEALTAWIEADSTVKMADDARLKAEEQLQNLQGALVQAEHDRQRTAPKNRRGRYADLETSFSLFLPNLIFLRDSLRFVAEQVFDLRALLTQLTRLNASQTDLLESKKLRDANNWWETHFSTGQGRDGRLYYRPLEHRAGRGCEVVLSDKLAQSRDLEWLRRN